jgi:hypothetical protein
MGTAGHLLVVSERESKTFMLLDAARKICLKKFAGLCNYGERNVIDKILLNIILCHIRGGDPLETPVDHLNG